MRRSAPLHRLRQLASHLRAPLLSSSSVASPSPLAARTFASYSSAASPPGRPWIFTTSAAFHGKPGYRPAPASAGLGADHPLVAWREQAMREGKAPKEGAGHDWWFAEGVPEAEGAGSKGVVLGVAGASRSGSLSRARVPGGMELRHSALPGYPWGTRTRLTTSSRAQMASAGGKSRVSTRRTSRRCVSLSSEPLRPPFRCSSADGRRSSNGCARELHGRRSADAALFSLAVPHVVRPRAGPHGPVGAPAADQGRRGRRERHGARRPARRCVRGRHEGGRRRRRCVALSGYVGIALVVAEERN